MIDCKETNRQIREAKNCTDLYHTLSTVYDVFLKEFPILVVMKHRTEEYSEVYEELETFFVYNHVIRTRAKKMFDYKESAFLDHDCMLDAVMESDLLRSDYVEADATG